MDYQEDQMAMAQAVKQFLPNCSIRVKPPFPAYETLALQKGEIFIPDIMKLPGEFLRSSWEATAENGEPVASGVAYLWGNGTTVITSTDNAI